MTSSPSKGTALITSVLAAHGGLENWARVRKITARLSLGGPFWGARGWPEVYAGQTGLTPGMLSSLCFNPARSNRSWLRPSRCPKRLMPLRYLVEGRPFGRVVLTI